MPKVYRSPASSTGEGMTTYLAIGGPRGLFSKPDVAAGTQPRGLSMASVTDGTSNTIGLVEASDAKAVVWTKPDEFIPDEKDPLKGLPGPFPGGFLAGFCDGSVQFIRLSVDPKMLYYAFQRDDGNVIDLGR